MFVVHFTDILSPDTDDVLQFLLIKERKEKKKRKKPKQSKTK